MEKSFKSSIQKKEIININLLKRYFKNTKALHAHRLNINERNIRSHWQKALIVEFPYCVLH